jgi:alkanesulfonate monooxygenase SsuD/methylene tetrahydromethanopterin reductase-like flavin-dependent oxidoreductase (luciferase family)
MKFGAHLPLIDFDGNGFSLPMLTEYTKTAQQLGFDALSINDHYVFSRPWLDGPTALATVIPWSGEMKLFTTVALPVIRGPIGFAKTVVALDLLSNGRMNVGVGPGSSAKDYNAVGLSFDERWKRLDEAILSLRALWTSNSAPFKGNFYSTENVSLQPSPAHPEGPPIWIGSWGSEAGLRRTARLGDGWLASAYNTTPALFQTGWNRLREQLPKFGKDAESFPNAVATMFCYITEDRHEADYIVKEMLLKAIQRTEGELRQRLLIGPPTECAEKLAAYKQAGVQLVFLWPITDAVRQLEVFHHSVATRI